MSVRSRFLIALAVALCLANLLQAQGGANATILGSITDSSGAVLPKASVEVTNTSTGVSSHTQTTSSGDYTVPFLSPGTYKVTVAASGFETTVADKLNLIVGQQLRVNLALKPGATTETVEVQTGGIALDTDSSAVAQVVGQDQVENLPLNGRSFQQLLFIGGGAVQTGGEQSVGAKGAGSAISVNGSRPESNNYMIDGMLNTDQAFNTPAVILSVDAIQEFKVLSETYSAQYGFGTNQIIIASKSGTNQLRGSLFWFGRNDALDAKNYFLPQGQNKSPLRQNQFGYVLGGPVLLPKIYDGRDKTFFLANYEGWRIRLGQSGFGDVPPQNLLSGLFTDSVSDPTTGQPFPGCSANGTSYVSCIPKSRFTRLAQVALNDSFFPSSNCDPSTCQGFNRSVSYSLPTDTDQQTYRIDQDLGRWGKVFGRGSYYTGTFGAFNALPISGPLQELAWDMSGTNWAVVHTIPFGPHTANQFAFGRLVSVANSGGFTAPETVIQDLGLTNIFSNLGSGTRVYPTISFSNNAGQTQVSSVGGAINAASLSTTPMWQFVDSLTFIHGPHSFTFGGDYKRWSLQRNTEQNYLGTFTFAGYATGDQFADFLLGYYSGAQAPSPSPLTLPNTIGNPYEYNSQYFATYVQDDWKASRRLSLNLGLRWDFRTIPNETHNHLSWTDLTNPQGGICVADQKVFSEGFAGSSGLYRYCGSSPKPAEKKNFAPRVGFAWRPIGEKTVLRGGYGFYWDGVEGREIDGAAGIYPYSTSTSVSQFTGQSSYQSTDQLFPAFSGGAVIPGPTGQNGFRVLPLAAAPYLKNPYVQQYTLSLQRELAKNTVLEVNYIGNNGRHLLSRISINQAFPMADPAFCAIPANQSSNSCAVLARRPYPNFGVYLDEHFTNSSNYNAGTAKIDHQSTTLALTAVYTWSKSLDDKSAAAGIGSSSFNGWQGYLNNYDPKADYGRSDFDTGQRFVASAIYKLPVGRGTKVLGDANPVVNAVIGNWQINGIYTAQLGFPLSILAGDSTGLLDTFGTNRADLVGKASTPKTKTQWFTTSSFAQPAPNEFGSSGRNILRMPGINDFDIGLLKEITIHERARFQLRVESFNTFNHPQFDPDPSLPAFSGGGTTIGNNVGDPATFGRITASGLAREVQLGAKILF